MSENHLNVVQQVKAALEAANVPLQGSCGAGKITNRVANILNAGQPLDDHGRPPWGLLLKAGGNRFVPQPDGSCLDGDHSSAPGYATDYLIERGTWFGFDILGDGGGANNPQWPDEPETAPDMVERNRQNFRAPVPDGNGPPPPPPPPPPADLTARVATLERDLEEARGEIAVLEAKVQTLEQGPRGDIEDLIARVVALENSKPGDVSKLVTRVAELEAKKIPNGGTVLGYLPVTLTYPKEK